MIPTEQKSIFGYFKNADDTPTYDPGLEVPCPLCGKSLHGRPRKTISVWYEDKTSHFYRTHKDCYENASAEDITQIEAILLDTLTGRRSLINSIISEVKNL